MEDNEEKLGASETALYRALAARANYLAADRTDVQYAVKEICRGMVEPMKLHLGRLRRLGRYLLGRPRAVWRYTWQAPE